MLTGRILRSLRYAGGAAIAVVFAVGTALSPVCGAAGAATPVAASAAAQPLGPAVWPGPQPQPSDWPQFMRGSYHEGWNQPESLLTAATVGGLTVTWSVPVTPALRGIGTPIVVGNAVFLGGQTMTRHNAADGSLEWSTALAPGSDVATTPAYAHGLVVAATTSNPTTVAALDATTGAVVWEKLVAGDSTSSPTIFRDTVFLGVGDQSVVALSLQTGAVRWRWTSRRPSEQISSPTTDGKLVYVATLGGTRVIALDAASGSLVWARTLGTGNAERRDGFAISLIGGRLYLGSCTGKVYALDATTGHTIWRADAGRFFSAPVTVSPRVAFAVTTDPVGGDTLLALSRTHGRLLWSRSASAIDASATVAAGIAYVVNTDSGIARADVLLMLDETTGEQLAQVVLATGTMLSGGGPPTISAGRVVVVVENRLVALGLPVATGSALIRFESGGSGS